MASHIFKEFYTKTTVNWHLIEPMKTSYSNQKHKLFHHIFESRFFLVKVVLYTYVVLYHIEPRVL